MPTPPVPPLPGAAQPGGADTQQSIARAATITSIGNLTSRVVGFARDIVKSYYFGNGQQASAFELASNLPTQFNDLLVGGMLSSALVPTFSHAVSGDCDAECRADFGRLVGALVGLLAVAVSLVVLVLWIFAEPVAGFISGGRNQDVAMVATLLRVTIPAIIFLNISGILTAALHARRRFNYTAFTATTFNLVMIVLVVALERWLGITALAIGMLAGSVAQVLLQLPGLRGVPVRISLNFRHPGIAQILRLWLPVAGGLALAQIAVQISFIFASRISQEGPITMRYAANIIQFPLGMVASAISAAILPALSGFARADEAGSRDGNFAATLARGLRLVAVLIVPAAVGLFVLAQPVIGIIYERGAFTPDSTAYTALALRAAAPNLIFAALDRLLIFGFYAQRNTRTPTLIGLASTAFYLAVVGVLGGLDSVGARTFTLADLVLSDSLKTGVDMLLMGIFLWRAVGGLRGHGLSALAARITAASAVMGLAVWQVMVLLQGRLGTSGFAAHAGVALGASLAGAMLYLGACTLLRVPELSLARLVRRR